MTTSVLLVDDHVVIAQALASALRDAGFGPVQHVPVDSLDHDGILAAARELRPDVVLVDLNLGSAGSGLLVIPALVESGVRVVAFTADEDALAAAWSVEAGASGFLNKSEAFETVTTYVEAVARGESVIPSSRREELLALARSTRAEHERRRQPFTALTERERQVLAKLVLGMSAADIADEQFVSVSTVRTHIEAIRNKLGVRSQLAAVALAREVGWTAD